MTSVVVWARPSGHPLTAHAFVGVAPSSPQSLNSCPWPWDLTARKGRPWRARIFCPFMPRDFPAGCTRFCLYSSNLTSRGGPADDSAPRFLKA